MAQLVSGPSPRRYPARITADMLFQLRICRSTRLPVDFGVRTRRVPRQNWVIYNMASWSIVTVCTGMSSLSVPDVKDRMLTRDESQPGQSRTEDYSPLRVFLGNFESTILPSFVLIIQMWWTRRVQSYERSSIRSPSAFPGIFGMSRLTTYPDAHVGFRPTDGFWYRRSDDPHVQFDPALPGHLRFPRLRLAGFRPPHLVHDAQFARLP